MTLELGPSTVLADLSERFRANEHEYDPKGNVYISVQATIKRLNAVCPEWDWEVSHATNVETGSTTSNGKPIYLGTVIGSLHIPGLGNRSGSGSDASFDPDTAIKAAQAYALRKAANQFGVALYLLGKSPAAEEERSTIVTLNRCYGKELGPLKAAVKAVAAQEGAELTAKGIAEHFQVTVEDLQSPDMLYGLLALAGRL